MVPCERTAKFAADMRLGSTADDCAIGVRLRPPYGHDGGAAVIACMNGINREGIA